MIDGETSAQTHVEGRPTHDSSTGELDLEAVGHFEQTAAGYLDTADAVIEAMDAYTEHLITIQPESFAASGVSGPDLAALGKYGARLDAAASIVVNNKKPGPGQNLPKQLVPLVHSYPQLSESEVFTDVLTANDKTRINALSAAAAAPSADKEALDQHIAEISATSSSIPPVHSMHAVVGLGVVHLSQFFQRPDVRKKMKENLVLSGDFKILLPDEHASIFVGTYLVEGNQTAKLAKTLGDLLPDSAGDPSERKQIIDSFTTELRLFESMTNDMQEYHQKVSLAYKSVVDTALERAAEAMRELVDCAPAGAEDGDIEHRLEVEARVATVNKSVARRIKKILVAANSLRTDLAADIPQFSLDQPLPAPETPLANRLKQQKAAEASGTLATRQAAEQEERQSLIRELADLQAPYAMSRPDTKKIPGSNGLTAMMVKGEVGDEDCVAEPLAKEEAYAVAGLLYRLNDLLDQQSRNNVFDQLFTAYEKESALTGQLGEHAIDFSLVRSCDWLIDSVAALQASESEILNQVGDGLALYGHMRRTPIGQRIERASRQISAQTLQAIEAARINAESLEIRAFPPGISNLEDLEEDVLEIATRPGSRNIPTLDWERLIAIDDLGVVYSSAGYNTQLFRLLPGSLNERFPYYALVINKGEHRAVVAENPKTGNATYVFEELDPRVATWTEMVQLDKKAVRELGGRAMTHNAKNTTQQHFQRVNDEVALRLSAS